MMLNKLKNCALGLMLALLSACGQAPETQMVRQAVAIESGDECHLCGMIIENFPGPKGELYTKTADSTKKFCSTRDMFSFLLDPEYLHQVKEVYVHDMTKAPWGSPKDSYFIDAKKAWYAVGSSQKGAMGETLASFGTQVDALSFVKEFGGKVYRFDEITLSLL